MSRRAAPWWLVAGVVPAMFVAINTAMLIVYWDRLPSPVASHWAFGGQPNDSMPPAVLSIIILGGCVVAWGGLWVARSNPGRALSVALAYFMMGLFTGVNASTIAANLDVAEWADANLAPWAIPTVLFAGIAAGGIGLLLAGGSSLLPQPEVIDASPTVELAAGQNAVWSGSAGSIVLVAVGVGAAVVAYLVGGSLGIFLAIVIAIPVLTLSAVRVTVSSRGVTTTLGWVGWPRWTTPLSAIDSASVIDVRPTEFGGWGYRIRPGIRAVVIRAGYGIRIDRTDRPALVVTVDDAGRGAGLINDLASRTAPQ